MSATTKPKKWHPGIEVLRIEEMLKTLHERTEEHMAGKSPEDRIAWEWADAAVTKWRENAVFVFRFFMEAIEKDSDPWNKTL